jgi:hypothetical protein
MGFAEALTPLKTQLVLGIIGKTPRNIPPSIQLVEAQLVFSLLGGGFGPPVPCALLGVGVSQPENNRLTVRVAMMNNASSIGRRPASFNTFLLIFVLI